MTLMNTQTPQPGDVITVTTRYPDHYYKRTSDFKETTYENVEVIKSLPWLQAHEFCVAADGPESQFAKIDTVERHDRAPEFDCQAMRYEGKYIPSDNLPKFDTRVISMKNVVAINGKPVEQYKESIQQFLIPASRGGNYSVRVENGVGKSCDCKGFQFRGHCRHLNEAEKLV